MIQHGVPEQNHGYKILRKTGHIENFFVAAFELGFYNCVIVAAQYNQSNAERSSFNNAAIYLALEHVIHTHAALCVSVDYTSESGEAYFYRLDSIDLDKVVHFTKECTIQDAINTTLNIPIRIQDGLPLWRVTVTPDNHVLFAYNHCIGDGRSGLAFHKSFHEGLNHQVQAMEKKETLPSIVVISADAKLLPPIESLVKLSKAWYKPSLEIIQDVLPEKWRHSSLQSIWTGKMTPLNPYMHTTCRIINLSPVFLGSFLSVMREHKATLTSTLYILAVSVFSQLILLDPKNRRFKKVTTSIPMCLRSYVNVPEESTICNYVTAEKKKESLRPGVFSWVAAEKKANAFRFSKKKALAFYGDIGRATNFEKHYKTRLGAKRRTTFEISNLGAFKLKSASINVVKPPVWSLGSTYFAQSGLADAALFINVVGNPMGGASICICWETDGLEESFVKTFIKQLDEAMHNLVQEDVTT